jgi:hypothetical protein
MPKLTSTPAHQRFWDYVNEGPWWECWEWQGAITSFGYGMLGRGRRGEGNILAHRLSYEMAHDASIPAGMDLCHECNNRRCVNPNHLYIGTRKDNMQQAKRDGRLHWQKAKA